MRKSRQHFPTQPEELLQVRWRFLSLDEIDIYLKRILVAEHHRFPRIYRNLAVPKKRWLTGRLRVRRLAVATYFLAHGGKASSRILHHSLPHGRQWPGLIHLIGSYTDEDLDHGRNA